MSQPPPPPPPSRGPSQHDSERFGLRDLMHPSTRTDPWEASQASRGAANGPTRRGDAEPLIPLLLIAGMICATLGLLVMGAGVYLDYFADRATSPNELRDRSQGVILLASIFVGFPWLILGLALLGFQQEFTVLRAVIRQRLP